MMTSKPSIYALILAAGQSSRFGSPKQLAVWQQRTLLQHTLIQVTHVFNTNIRVVLGAHAQQIAQTVDLTLTSIVINPDWQHGLSRSIACGIKALPNQAQAVMLVLCDQPLVNTESLNRLMSSWQQHPDAIVASEYNGTLGVPAIFPAALFSELASLTGDSGAKHLLHSQQHQVMTVSLPEAACDIDTQDDLHHLTMQHPL